MDQKIERTLVDLKARLLCLCIEVRAPTRVLFLPLKGPLNPRGLSLKSDELLLCGLNQVIAAPRISVRLGYLPDVEREESLDESTAPGILLLPKSHIPALGSRGRIERGPPSQFGKIRAVPQLLQHLHGLFFGGHGNVTAPDLPLAVQAEGVVLGADFGFRH